MKKICLLTVLGFFLSPAPLRADESPAVFHSPKGQFDIRFVPQTERLYPTPYERTLPSGTKSQIYSLSFCPTGQNAAVAMTYFTDIQRASTEKFPTPLAMLVKQMLWSPEEDFVVLPAEAWPAHPGEAIPAQAVSLRSSSSWQFVDFPLQTTGLRWVNPLQVIGNSVEGCRHDVKEFDANNGRTTVYQTANPPAGYEILSSDGNTIVLKKVLGDCATDADRKTFQADCIMMNTSFGRGETGACPP